MRSLLGKLLTQFCENIGNVNSFECFTLLLLGGKGFPYRKKSGACTNFFPPNKQAFSLLLLDNDWTFMPRYSHEHSDIESSLHILFDSTTSWRIVSLSTSSSRCVMDVSVSLSVLSLLWDSNLYSSSIQIGKIIWKIDFVVALFSTKVWTGVKDIKWKVSIKLY